MQDETDQRLALLEARSLREAEYLAGEFARTAAKDREAILAGLEFEQWLAEACRDAKAIRLSN